MVFEGGGEWLASCGEQGWRASQAKPLRREGGGLGRAFACECRLRGAG